MNKERNKTFIALVVVAVIALIGLIGTSEGGFGRVWYFTGFGTTASGSATINITGAFSIKLIDNSIAFGNGTFVAPALFAILESNGSAVINGTWVSVDDCFILENDGNALANITIKAGSSAATWFGGTAGYAAMYYRYLNNETGACLLDTTFAPLMNSTNGTWLTLPVNPAVNGTCQKLNYSDTADQMRIDMKIQVPADAPAGDKENSVTFTASQSA